MKAYHGRRIIKDQNIKTSLKKALAFLMTLCIAGSLFFPYSALAAAPVGCMPGVTEEMTEPSFWYHLSDDPDAAEEMPVRWGIAVNRTELITFPWDGQILDDPKDFDFDYQPLVGIRVNEPVAIYSTSADGKYFQVSASCCTYRDPNAGTTVTIDYSTFEKSFTELGGRIVYYAFQH